MVSRILLFTGALLLLSGSLAAQQTTIELGDAVLQQDRNTVVGTVSGNEKFNRAEPIAIVDADQKGVRALSLSSGDSIAVTGYDFQTNATMTDRIINWGKDGVQPTSVEATLLWMASSTLHPTTDDRGTYGAVQVDVGDGNLDWFPINLDTWERIEDTRSGFPEVDYLKSGENAGVLVAVSHRNDENGISVILETGGPGSGEFLVVTIPGSINGLWPRVSVDDENGIHVIWGYQNVDPTGNPTIQSGEIRYSRSLDLGTNWSEPLLIGPLDVNNQPTAQSSGGDTYQIDANGTNVAIWFASRNAQIYQFYSSNQGQNFLVTVPGVFEWPRRFHPDENRSPDSTFFTVDTIWGGDTVGYRGDDLAAPGTGFDMMILDDGSVLGIYNEIPGYIRNYLAPGETFEVWRQAGGRLPVIFLEAGEFTDRAFRCVRHIIDTEFNESELVTSTLVPLPEGLTDQIRFFRPRGNASSMARWPQLGIDAEGDVLLVYGSGKADDTETIQDPLLTEPGEYYYSHTYAVRSTNNGESWTMPQDLTPDGVDAQFATLANWIDDKAYVAVQTDNFPGDYLTAYSDTVTVVHPATPSNIEVMALESSSFAPTSVGQAELVHGNFGINGVSPNPASGPVTLDYSIGTSGEATLELVDNSGKVVRTIHNGRRVAGDYSLTTSFSDLASGQYHLVLTMGGTSKTFPVNVVR